ncbi:hypothetical protein FD13_GL001987 [Levilactobacillus senmaizukei DSM 21775 = NBRC 103853]|uniref:DNA-binding protein n=1 Tax=Levilactobacillus senmaizukei DSM 21775 = NBRC 103853 TaxID=1423803 RepID=A0A0R2DQY2_9LACO|nr:PAS domain-containing protein [Levilactobacillus senmaizukei]KRN02308.1 hypothetical protein FD13_GL001987 [Levilactobacillus senmaizukei DSM 21775 = NBRC 103853]
MSKTLNEYRQLVHFLGQTLGKDYEIVLHWKSERNSFYIAAIEHSYISGRNMNSPITGFALQLVQDKVYLQKDYVTQYFATTDDNRKIQGSTYFIKDGADGICGLLCINFDTSRYVNLANEVLRMTGVDMPSVNHLIQPNDGETDAVATLSEPVAAAKPAEALHADVEAIINSSIDPQLLQPGVVMTPETRVQIVQELSDKGVFQIKGVMPHVAKVLGVSEPSVYRYLRMIDKP